ncbi:sugar ABC transporter ATP-binding protein [uncultured Sphaerochaeta sp.]|uniref:sugar ABC transporter ATP-binding protein n=1 Tax=uncultured Sphaerochaeta sp. TaxID=886478 RepID=UPI0029CA4BD6|nr:sugar ABC transporter ATP-binding protein [uncultured Sphaerochaeta sp.]
MGANILELHDIVKGFSRTQVLHEVSLNIKQGSVHALMGENGAGKSTLIKIITGIYQADSGEMNYNGSTGFFKNSLEAQHAGISAIYQELNLLPYLSVAENIFISNYPFKKNGSIDWTQVYQKAQRLIDDIHIDIDVRQPVRGYGTAKQQIVAIIRAINMKSKLVIMDEPTSSLDSNEVEVLFSLIDMLKAKGIAVIFISHRIDEVYKKCDEISILRDGHLIGTYKTEELPHMKLLEKMIGRQYVESSRKSKRTCTDELLLEVDHLKQEPKVQDVSFTVHKGEIVGLAGLLGSGRTEVAHLIFGLAKRDAGTVLFEGDEKASSSPSLALKHKMAFCTENRREEGIFPNASIINNMCACANDSISKMGIIDYKKKVDLTNHYCNKMRVKKTGILQRIKFLSGGNQQKVVVGRWLSTNPKFIILDEPTRGIDVGAKQEIENLIQEFAENGIGVLLISSEQQELVRNCDKIIVLNNGVSIGELADDAISERRILEMIAADNEKINRECITYERK